MAQLNNNQPGITPPGSGPQDDGTGTNNNNQPGQGEKLIAGKFRTVEEAVEKGYMGLEQGFHALSEQVGGLVRIMESAMNPQTDSRGNANSNNVPIGNSGPSGYGAPDPYGRGGYDPRQDEDYIDPAQFVVNPTQHLKQRDQRLISRVIQQVGEVVTNVVTNQQVVNDFKTRNPDLIPHEKLVGAFMRDLDQRIPLAKRLDTAAQQAREYLGQVRGGGSNSGFNPPPAPGHYVEAPRGPAGLGSGGSGNTNANNNQAATSEDDSEDGLIQYINERNAGLAANFGYGFKK